MAIGERLKEANNINKSLTVLGQVINCLVENSQGKSRHIPYRDSKLTFILKDSLGGNSKTYMIAAISSASNAFAETLSTLKFAQRAKMIKNKALINEESSGNLEMLKKELKRLKDELLTATKLINDMEQKQNELKDVNQIFQAKLTPNYEILLEKTQKVQPSRCKIISITKNQVENEKVLEFETSWKENLRELRGKFQEIEERSEEITEKQEKMNSMLYVCAQNEMNYRMIIKLSNLRLSRPNNSLNNCTNDSLLQEIMNLKEENFRLNEILDNSVKLISFNQKKTSPKNKIHLFNLLSENKILLETMSKQIETKLIQQKRHLNETNGAGNDFEMRNYNEFKQIFENTIQENTMYLHK